MGDGTDNPKPRLRRELEARRRAIAAGELARAGAALCDHLVASAEFGRARHVVLYAARAWEVDPRTVEAAARRGGATTYYPRVEGDQLTFRQAGIADLTPGRFGVPEPTGGSALLDPTEREVIVLVPGVAFDRFGGRLGTGRGYYDRALATLAGARRIGLTLEALVVPRVPTDSWDVAMDALATERGLFVVGGRVDAHSGDHPWTPPS